jgi:hypothetical protein
MNAREKLNVIHIAGAVVLAGIAGLVTGSALIFGLVLIVLILAQLHGGGLRPPRSGH